MIKTHEVYGILPLVIVVVVVENGVNYIMRNLVICTPYPILCGW